MKILRQLKDLIGGRGRVILKVGSWSLVAKICAACNLFGSVPFALNALDPAQFGAWAVLVSIVAFSGFLDLGFGNGAMNLVASAHGRGSNAEVATITREGWRILLVVAAALAAVSIVAIAFVPWHRIIGLPLALADMTRNSVAIVLFAVVLSVPLNLGSRIQLGLGRGDRAARWQALGQLGALAAVVLASRYHPTLLALCAASVIAPLLGAFANTLALARDPILAGPASLAGENPRRVRANILREGWIFFALQLAAALSFSADLMLISALVGPQQAGTYAIVQRVFSLIPLVLGLVWSPLWPLYRSALGARDHHWVAQTLRRTIVAAVALAAISGLGIALTLNTIVQFWVPGTATASSLLLAGFTVWVIFEAAGTAVATFLNSASVLRFQLLCSTAFAFSCVTCKIVALVHFGVDLVPWVTVVTYALTFILPLLIWWPKIKLQSFGRQY